jgi:hypothetical protein
VKTSVKISPGPDIQEMAPYAYSCYLALVLQEESRFSQQLGLGGRLLYSGELDEEGRAIVIGGNVAGCATLSVAADPTAQKKAIHDGIVDFLVTSLDEALRILKNEIRKRATVAVCVGKPAEEVEQEMLERGVQPDIIRENVKSCLKAMGQDSAESRKVRIIWMLEAAQQSWLPKVDAIAEECLNTTDTWNRRWIRLAPRYLRKVALNTRLVDADREFADRFIQRARAAYQTGELPAMPKVLVLGFAPTDDHQTGDDRITPQAL